MSKPVMRCSMWAIALVALTLGASCGTEPSNGEMDSGATDGGDGGSVDAGFDGGEDAGPPDAGPDAGFDGGYDAGQLTISVTAATGIEGDTTGGTVNFVVALSRSDDAAVTVAYATEDVTATSDDYQPTSGTLTFAPGVTFQTISVPLQGDLFDEENETFTLTLSNVTGPATLLTPSVTGTIQDDDATPTLTVASFSVAESAPTASFVLTISAPSALPIAVSFATAEGTASSSGDFLPLGGLATIAPGETSTTVNVTLTSDALDEDDETLLLDLSNATNAVLMTTQAVATIVDDDALPSISVGDVTVQEGNAGSTEAAFYVQLSTASGRAVTITYATSNGTATSGDYTSTSGALTFAPGETLQNVFVGVVGDVSNEGNETFKLTLSNPVHATVANAIGTATILNDDGPPTLNVNDYSGLEGNDGGATDFAVDVVLLPAAGVPVTVQYTTAAGTGATPALTPEDFATTTGVLFFDAGVTTRTIHVPVRADSKYESNEAFGMTLSNPNNAVLGKATATIAIVNDDTPPTALISSATTVEGSDGGLNPLVFDITLSSPSGLPASVSWATTPGTALATVDYAVDSGTVTFAPGELLKQITVGVVRDALYEVDETVKVNLSSATGAVLATAQGVGTITNDDPIPTCWVVDDTATEGGTAASPTSKVNLGFNFTTSALAGAGREPTVSWTTVDGTATAPGDYTAKTATHTFSVSAATGATVNKVLGILIPVTPDLIHENTETMTLNITSVANCTLTDGSAVGTIVDNDP